MSNKARYISDADIEVIGKQKQSKKAIIFLSGPTSLKTPVSLLQSHDVIAVNGSARYLLNNDVSPFIYVLTDARFLQQRGDDFRDFVSKSNFTIVNRDVYEAASEVDRKYLDEYCFVIKPLYKREKGGVFKKLKLGMLSAFDKNILIQVPWSKRKRLAGFSLNITHGYCSCHTIAFTALQIAYTLGYEKIVYSGLDLTGSCSRFYDENNNPMPSELSNDLTKILPFYAFTRKILPDIPVYNLSDDSAVDRRYVPFISPENV
nr:3-deoxy-D-manno-oct-2-ulosonate III transferase WaaZ [uncultured Enterobacter sp.]